MTRFYHRITIISIVLLTTGICNAYAQRTMEGQSSIEAGASYNGMAGGVSIDYSQYTLNGFWYTGVSGNDCFALYTKDSRIRYDHICLYGGYLFRLVGTRSRSINLYGGSEVLVGIELTDPYGELPLQLSAGIEHFRFLYGIAPRILSEFFISSRFAFTVFGSIPINFSSAYSNIGYNTGIGVKIML